MPKLPAVSPELIKKYQDEIAKKTTEATAKRKSASLNKFFDWAADQGHIDASPMPPSPVNIGNDSVIISSKPTRHIGLRTWAILSTTLGIVIIIILLSLRFGSPIEYIKNLAAGTNNNPTAQIVINNQNVLPSAAPGSLPTATISATPAVNGSWNLYATLKLTSSQGTPQVGSETISFKLYSSQTGGAALYTSDPQTVTTDSQGSALISLDKVPSNLFFQNNRLYLEPSVGSTVVSERIPISTANVAANLGGYFPANPDTGATELTVPVIDSGGSLNLASQTPAINGKAGNLLVEGQAVTIKAVDGGNGNITINPDGSGIAQFLFEGSSGNQLNVLSPNLNSGSLIFGSVTNNSTGYDLLKLQSGSSPTTKFEVDSQGNTTIRGNVNLTNGGLEIAGVTRLSNLGRLSSITGYYQDSGQFGINQGAPDTATITKTLTNATGAATADTLNLTLDESQLAAGSNSNTLVLNRLGGSSSALALLVNSGNAKFNGQVQLGNFSSNPNAIGAGSLVYNTSDGKVYYWNGTSWQSFSTGSNTFSGSFADLTSGTNNTAAMVVGTGASLTTSGTGTITATSVNCVSCITNSNLVNSSITFAGDSGSSPISLGGTETISGSNGITTTQAGSTLTVSGTNATTGSVGVASFDPNFFTVTAGNVSILANSFDFAQFKDALTLDASTNIAMGGFTLSTSGTGALNFGSTGQVTFAGNVDATNGLDVTNANLTVGGTNFSVNQANGNVTTAGTITLPNSNTLTGVAGYVQNSQGYSVGGGTTFHFDSSGNVVANDVAVNGGNLTSTQSTVNIFTSSSTVGIGAGTGTTTIDNSLQVIGATNLNGNSTFGDTTGDTITFTGRVNSNIIPSATATYDLGSPALKWNNVYAIAFNQNGNPVCDSSGANCPAGAGFWAQTLGALYPTNNTVDLLIGATAGTTATQSAKFAFTGVNSGTPTASIAGTVANVATFLDGNGNISATNRNNLTLGNSSTYNTTGNILLNPNSTGFVGIGTPTPGMALDINGTARIQAGNGLYFNNPDNSRNSRILNSGTTGNSIIQFFTGAGVAPAEKVRIDENGKLGVGTATPTALLDVAGDASISGHFVMRGTTPDYLHILNGSDFRISTSVGGDTGNTDVFTVLNSGKIGIGDTSPASLLTVGSGDAFQVDSTGNVSTSGTTGITLTGADSDITFATGAGNHDITASAGTLRIGAATLLGAITGNNQNITGIGDLSVNGNTTLGDATGDTITFTGRVNSSILPSVTGTDDLGSNALRWNNVYATAFFQNGNAVCDASGTGCPPGSTNFWGQTLGALYPLNNSVDLLIGATPGTTATQSAKFAFTGVNTGLPTASIAGDIANVATYLTGDGNLATTNMRDLTLGSSSTGNVVLNSRGVTSLTANAANLTAAGTLTFPNSNTLTGVANYLQNSQGFSVGGGTTYFFDGSGNINANTGTFAGNVAVNGGNLTTTQTTANLFTNATTLGIGNASGTTTINNALTSITGNLTVVGTTGETLSGTGAGITFSGTGTHAISNSSAGTNLTLDAGTTGQIQIAGSSTGDILIGGGASSTGCTITNTTGDLACSGNIAANGGSLTTTATTANLFTGATTLLNIGPPSNVGSIAFSGGSGDTGCTLDGTNGNLTCTGAISGSSSTSTLKWNALTNPDGDLTLAMGANKTTFGWTSVGALDGWTMNFNNNSTSSTTQDAVVINNAPVGSFTDTATENLLLVQQLDTTAAGTTGVTNAIKVDAAANSGITNGITVTNSAGNITNGINVADTAGGTLTTGINFSGTFNNEISLRNGQTIDNGTSGTINLGTTTLKLTGGTDIVSDQSSVNLLNATTTTLNIGGAALTVNLQGASGTTLNLGNINDGSKVNINAGTNPITFNSAVDTGAGSSAAYMFRDAAITSGDLIYVNGGNPSTFTGNFLKFDNSAVTKYLIDSAGDSSQSGNIIIGNGSVIQPAFGPLTLNYKSGANTWAAGFTLTDTTGNAVIAQSLAVNGGSITTSQLTGNLFNTTATTVNIGGGATTTMNIGPTGANGTIALSGGSGDTGCILNGVNGNFTCTGSITSTNTTSGTQGFWQLNSSVLAPANTSNALAVGGTTTAAPFFVDTSGNITSTGGTGLTLSGSGAGIVFSGASAHAISVSAATQNLTIDAGTTGQVQIGGSSSGDILLGGGGASTGCTVTNSNGNFDCAGVLEIGGSAATTFSRFGTATSDHSLSAAQDVLIGGNEELNGTLFLDGKIIASTNGTSTITFPTDPVAINSFNVLTNGSWLIQNAAAGNPGIAALMVDQDKAGDIFTASASGVTKFTIDKNGNTTMAGDLTITGGNITNAITADSTLTTTGTLTANGTFTANGIVNLGDSGDLITISGSDTNIAVADGSTVNLDGDGSPTADLFQIGSGDTSATSGVDALFANMAVSNVSGDMIHITPAFTSTTTGLTYNGFEADAFTATNTTGTDTVNGIKLGNLTEAGAGAITSTALNVGSGWDTDLNATTSLTIGISGTNELTLTSTALSPSTSDGNALGTGSLMWSDLFLASGAVINWNNGDLTLTHAANALTLAGGSLTVEDFSTTGNTTIGDASTDTLTANASSWTFANDTNFVLSGGVNGLSFDTNTLSIDGTNGRVGIGTTAPGEALDVAGNIKLNATGNKLLSLNSASTTNAIYVPSATSRWTLDSVGSIVMALDTDNNEVAALTIFANAADTAGTQLFQLSETAGGTLAIGGGFSFGVPAASGTFGICHTTNGAQAAAVISDCNGAPLDIAEFYPGVADEEPGDLVTLSEDPTTGFRTIKSSKPYDQNIIGVVSTIPTGPNGKPMGQGTISESENPQAIGLSGRVVVKVSLENGPIKVNDWLTTSSVPGVAMRASKASRVIGVALEPYDGETQVSEGSREQEKIRRDTNITVNKNPVDPPVGIGKILVFTNLTYYDPYLAITNTGDLNIAQNQNGSYQLTDTSNNNSIIDRVGAFGQMVAANIKAGAIAATDFIADNVVAKVIHTSIISPLPDSTDVTVQIGSEATPSGKFAIQNSAGTQVASVDNQGNASFSGTLTTDAINASEATFSGEVHAKNIDDIQALLTQVATDQNVLLAATSSANLNATGSASLAELITNDLFVTGQAAVSSISIADSLTLGSDLVIGGGGNTINSLSAPLRLQSLAMAPVEIMGGLVAIDTHGNMQIAGNLSVGGRIQSSGLTLKDYMQGQSLQNEATSSANLLDLQNSSGQTVSSVNASGSASFSNLTTGGLTIASDSMATDSAVINGTITTNATAGSAVVPAGTSEITVKNPKVTDYTLVYVTPTSSTQNNVLFVKSKQAGQFVVGFTDAMNSDAHFNWWIVQIQN